MQNIIRRSWLRVGTNIIISLLYLTFFTKCFFENIAKSTEKNDIWEHYFPKEWKITKNNLENKKNIIAKISRYKFLQWAQVRIWQAKEEFDRDLDDISRNLFPEVEPIIRARILIFIFTGYGRNRVKSVVE